MSGFPDISDMQQMDPCTTFLGASNGSWLHVPHAGQPRNAVHPPTPLPGQTGPSAMLPSPTPLQHVLEGDQLQLGNKPKKLSPHCLLRELGIMLSWGSYVAQVSFTCESMLC